jgi:hypothetical protein
LYAEWRAPLFPPLKSVFTGLSLFPSQFVLDVPADRRRQSKLCEPGLRLNRFGARAERALLIQKDGCTVSSGIDIRKGAQSGLPSGLVAVQG